MGANIIIFRSCFELFEMFFEVKNLHFLPASSVRYLPWKKRSKLKFFTLKPSNKQFKTASQNKPNSDTTIE